MDDSRRKQIDNLYEHQWGGTFRASEAVGATEDEIAALLGLVGKPLPESYLDFLRHYDDMADSLWGAARVIEGNFGHGQRHRDVLQQLFGNHLLIGGEHTGFDLGLDLDAETTEKINVTEWVMDAHHIEKRWPNFDSFLDDWIAEAMR